MTVSPEAAPQIPVEFSFAHLTGKGVRIGIIDSGVDASHPDVGPVIGGVDLHLGEGGEVAYGDEFTDRVGHGTACAGIIAKKAPDAELFSIRILNSDLAAHGTALAAAIRWGADRGMHVLNLSLGTTDRRQMAKLGEACSYARERGVVLVAALHQDGICSYPSAFPGVISVAAGDVCGTYAYGYAAGADLFIARGNPQRLAWLEPRHILMGGTSFAAPHITAFVALIRECHPEGDADRVREMLIEHAAFRKESAAPSVRAEGADEKRYGWIRKAVIYPYSKEMHAFIRFKDLLNFQIIGVVDSLGRGQVGEDAGTVIGMEPVGLTITHKLEKALQEADTLILGYVDQIGRIAGRDATTDTIQMALDMGKNVFSFAGIREVESLRREGLHLEYPDVTQEAQQIPESDQLRRVRAPVVGVFGTGPDQGKFTAQLMLRRKLLQAGYRVGQVGTEPHAELLGCDLCLPIGYASPVRLSVSYYIPYLRWKMGEIDARDPDIILAGAQSGIIPYDLSNPSDVYTLASIAFLFGIQSDAHILAVNNIDSDEYIERNIRTLESMTRKKVILFIVSGKAKDIKRSYGAKRLIQRRMSETEIRERIDYLETRFAIPATEVISPEGQEKLLGTVVDYLSTER